MEIPQIMQQRKRPEEAVFPLASTTVRIDQGSVTVPDDQVAATFSGMGAGPTDAQYLAGMGIQPGTPRFDEIMGRNRPAAGPAMSMPAVMAAAPSSTFNQVRTATNIPTSVMQAMMSGKNPRRIAQWAGSTQGRNMGGMAAISDMMNPGRAEARNLANEDRRLQQAMDRRKLEGLARGMGADPNRIAELSLPDLAGFITEEEARRVDSRRQQEMQQQMQQEMQQQNFGNLMQGLTQFSTAMERGEDLSTFQFPQGYDEQSFRQLAENPALQPAITATRAGIPLSPEEVYKNISSYKPERTPGPLAAQEVEGFGTVLTQDGRFLGQAPNEPQERFSQFEASLQRGVEQGLFTPEEAQKLQREQLRRQAEGSGGVDPTLVMMAMGQGLSFDQAVATIRGETAQPVAPEPAPAVDKSQLLKRLGL